MDSSDPSYDALGTAVDTVAVQVTDNDAAGIEVLMVEDTVTEGDASVGGYKVRLLSKPTKNVTLTINPDDQVTSMTSTLTFTPTNWDTYQEVDVEAVDDAVCRRHAHRSRFPRLGEFRSLLLGAHRRCRHADRAGRRRAWNRHRRWRIAGCR